MITAKHTGTRIGTGSPSKRRYRVQRSCLRCHFHKIRCDKTEPCSSCTKANATSGCRYPEMDYLPRAKKKPRDCTSDGSVTCVTERGDSQKTPFRGENQDIEDSILAALNSEPQRTSLALANVYNSPLASSGPAITEQASSLDPWFLETHMTESSQSSRQHGETRLPESHPNHTSARAGAAGLSGFSLRTPDGLHVILPPRWQASKLWGIYLQNVDCLIKVVHAPSMEKQLYAAVSLTQDVAPTFLALIFSVFLAATISVSDATLSAIGLEKQSAMSSFKDGIQWCFSQLPLSQFSDLNMLQALVIYQVCSGCVCMSDIRISD